MKTIKVASFDIKREGVSNEVYNVIDWNISVDVISNVNSNQKILGEDGLLLDPVDDDIFILISDGIHITSSGIFNGISLVKGFLKSDPEIIKNDDQLLKELI